MFKILFPDLLTQLESSFLGNNLNLGSLNLNANLLLNIPELLASGPLTLVQMNENLCVNSVFHNIEDLNTGVQKICTISIPPTELLQIHKEQQNNTESCDIEDLQVIISLKDEIKTLENDIKMMTELNEDLEQVHYSVKLMNMCQHVNDLDNRE